MILISEECISSVYSGLEEDKEEFLRVQELAEEDRDTHRVNSGQALSSTSALRLPVFL